MITYGTRVLWKVNNRIGIALGNLNAIRGDEKIASRLVFVDFGENFNGHPGPLYGSTTYIGTPTGWWVDHNDLAELPFSDPVVP